MISYNSITIRAEYNYNLSFKYNYHSVKQIRKSCLIKIIVDTNGMNIKNVWITGRFFSNDYQLWWTYSAERLFES